MKSIFLGIVVFAAVAVLVSPVMAGDFILKKDGSWHVNPPPSGGRKPLIEDFEHSKVQVTDWNFDAVMYRLEGVPTKQKLDNSKVAEVFWENPPKQWIEARSAMGSGAFEEAIAKFESLAKDKKARFWVRMFSFANMAEIYQAMGEWKEAVNSWDRLLRAFPKTKVYTHAHEQKAQAQLNMGDTAGAKATMAALARTPGLPEGDKQSSKYWLIYMKQWQAENTKPQNDGLLRQALSEYTKLLEDVEGKDELKNVAVKARLGIGSCLVLLKKYGEAIDFFKKITAASDDPAVLAGAFNGLGKCYFAQQKWDPALRAFLRTSINYGEEIPEQTAMALYYSGRCFHLLQGEDWNNRARLQYQECIKDYPGTKWAKMAREGILALPRTRGK
ncbi:MAG: tetratricopeptide repeat protein [Planctomycetota bacterium]|jgi:tetratricopeptide (TPR) repeat protein